MSALYDDSHRRLQRQFDTERLADRIEQRLFRSALTDDDKAFFERLEPASFVTPAYPEEQFVVVVSVREVFPNCPRYIHKFALVERSAFVPHAGVATPVPAWKQMDWARDALPKSDLAGVKI